MSPYYDRQGKPLKLLEWGRKLEDREYRRLAETTLPDGKRVSTVWIGLDHQFGERPPLIFETMVFPSRNDMDEQDCERYTTEAEAKAGHDAMVEKWSLRSVLP